jgi:geranylgeranyl reductase family protein
MSDRPRSADAQRWDAIVVGGGPGGSTAAWQLARGGARVLVLDAARFPRVKLCAGWVTPRVWRTLELEPKAYPLTLQPFGDATLELDGDVLQTRWGRTVSYGIVRREFDDFLLRRAAAAGAVVRDGARVESLDFEDEAVVTAAGEQHRAPIVIGAGGHNCPVARGAGAVSSEEKVVVARESETHVGAERLRELTHRHGTPELFAEPDFRGYGWYFTKGDYLNVGIGCLGDGRDLHRRCDAMLARLRADGRLPAEMPLEPFRGHAYAIRIDHPRQPSGNGFLLVGDAAGLARGVSGEGIGPAVESGAMAARAVLADPSAAQHLYRDSLTARFGTGEPGLGVRLLERLPHWTFEAVARTICRSRWLRRRLVFEEAFGMG